ncbi:MAG TPA: dihydroxy-acid dehydratase [Nakamurella sp.]
MVSLGETQVRPTAMLWRNMAAMATEEMLRANPIDGVVLLGGCDKTIPSLLMAAASVDLPAVVVPDGPMLTGAFRDPSWVGRRTTGDTMLGCGHCRRCLGGRQHVCEDRFEVGIRGGFPGALAEQLAVPASALRPLPDGVDVVAGALVEPGGNALRSVWAADLTPGDRVLVLGPGTIGLLVGMFAMAQGAEVHLMGRSERSLEFARTLGFPGVWSSDDLPGLPWNAVIDCSDAPTLPALALDLVEPGKRVVYVGLAGTPSTVDTRTIALKDLTAVGILSASPGLPGTIKEYAAGAVDPRPLVAATVGLHEAGAVLGGWRPPGAGAGPKIHIDPRKT